MREGVAGEARRQCHYEAEHLSRLVQVTVGSWMREGGALFNKRKRNNFILSYFRRCYWFRSDSLMADGYDRCILGFNTTTNRTQLISCKPETFKVGKMHSLKGQ
jgi:hypothetical protein